MEYLQYDVAGETVVRAERYPGNVDIPKVQ
jgi:hypothetical protein